MTYATGGNGSTEADLDQAAQEIAAAPDRGARTAPGARLVTRPADGPDEAALQALFAACEDYFLAATGLPSGPGDVQSMFYALPEGADPDDKRLLVVEADGEVVGLVDVVLRHPAQDTASVGLFLRAVLAVGGA
jgi:hypothetical protein